jgi:hypothetical protein
MPCLIGPGVFGIAPGAAKREVDLHWHLELDSFAAELCHELSLLRQQARKQSTNKNRGQLGPLADLAERLDVALSAITHPPKHSTQRAIDHFIGSQAYIAAARIGHMAVEEYEADESGHNQPTGRSLFTNPKNNMVRKMPTLAYRVVEQELDGGVKAARVMWEDIVDITADQAVAAATPSKRKDLSGPMMFLQATLTNGPVLKNIIEQRGAECGLSADQLKRAKQKLNVVTFKESWKMDGQWFWALPEDAPTGGTK